jgi:hypothetical protein
MDGIRTARASAVIQAVTRSAKSPRDPAAAGSRTQERFAAAPLAEEPPAAEPLAAVPLDDAPEAAQPAPGARLPIFESVESDWFHAHRQPPPPVTPPAVTPHDAAPARTPPNDDDRRAAKTIVTSAVGGVTAAGLPRRIPRANLVPGSADSPEGSPAGPADPAEVVSSRLAGFQRGSRRARASPPGARRPDE